MSYWSKIRAFRLFHDLRNLYLKHRHIQTVLNNEMKIDLCQFSIGAHHKPQPATLVHLSREVRRTLEFSGHTVHFVDSMNSSNYQITVGIKQNSRKKKKFSFFIDLTAGQFLQMISALRYLKCFAIRKLIVSLHYFKEPLETNGMKNALDEIWTQGKIGNSRTDNLREKDIIENRY